MMVCRPENTRQAGLQTTRPEDSQVLWRSKRLTRRVAFSFWTQRGVEPHAPETASGEAREQQISSSPRNRKGGACRLRRWVGASLPDSCLHRDDQYRSFRAALNVGELKRPDSSRRSNSRTINLPSPESRSASTFSRSASGST